MTPRASPPPYPSSYVALCNSSATLVAQDLAFLGHRVHVHIPHPGNGAAFYPVPGFGSRGGRAETWSACGGARQQGHVSAVATPGGIPGMKGGFNATSRQPYRVGAGGADPRRPPVGRRKLSLRLAPSQRPAALPISPRAAKAKALIQRRRGLLGHMMAVSVVLRPCAPALPHPLAVCPRHPSRRGHPHLVRAQRVLSAPAPIKGLVLGAQI